MASKLQTLSDQIKQIQELILIEAEKLGKLNIKNTLLLQDNQKITAQIAQMRNKIAKKTYTIQQQHKDKMIIHQKLNKAEREKQLLQIERNRNQQRMKQKQLQIKKTPKSNNQLKSVNNLKYETKPNYQQKKIINQSNLDNQSHFHKQKNTPIEVCNHLKQLEVQKNQVSSYEHYAGTDNGEYQPPILFAETEQTSEHSKSEDDQEIDAEILAKIKASALQDDQDDDQNDNQNDNQNDDKK